MRSVNKVILIGNLTRNPELRQTPNGQSVCTFGIATNREWSTQDSERHSLAEFHEVVAWAKLAEICSKFLKKGNLIYLEGYLKTRSWDTPEGVKKFKTEVIIQDMIRLEKRKDSNIENSEGYVPAEETPVEEETPVKEKAPIKAEKAPAEEPEEEPEEEKKGNNGVDIDGDLGL
ncbi:MAG: single-stranded DNA-binding protein [Patescibacteria group bacterium]|nr:single-stranded DNA-binding protein [Patescibacteria group bacterium]